MRGIRSYPISPEALLWQSMGDVVGGPARTSRSSKRCSRHGCGRGNCRVCSRRRDAGAGPAIVAADMAAITMADKVCEDKGDQAGAQQLTHASPSSCDARIPHALAEMDQRSE